MLVMDSVLGVKYQLKCCNSLKPEGYSPWETEFKIRMKKQSKQMKQMFQNCLDTWDAVRLQCFLRDCAVLGKT